MPMFREKLAEVEARRFEASDAGEQKRLAEWCGGLLCGVHQPQEKRRILIRINDSEGARIGDWIVRELCGSFEVYHPDDFEDRYEPVLVASGAHAPAKELAELVLSMGMLTPAGQRARHLARMVLGVPDPNHSGEDLVAITTNGTTRFIPRDEPVFLLRGQDVAGGDAVRAWATIADASGADFDLCQMAREHAAKMDTWPKKKVPDHPAILSLLPKEDGHAD